MGMADDLKAADQRYAQMIANGVPQDVAASIFNNPSFAEGENPSAGMGWPYPYQGNESEFLNPDERTLPLRKQMAVPRRAQDISYQPGGSPMAGGWDQGDGSPGQSPMLPQDVLKRLQTYQWLMQMRGPGGMQPTASPMQHLMAQTGMRGWNGQPAAIQPNALTGLGQQMGQGGLNPQMMQMLQYYLQNQANNLGPQPGGSMQGPGYPNGGGGVDLGAMMQALGFPSR